MDSYWSYTAVLDFPKPEKDETIFFVSKVIDYKFKIKLNGALLHEQEGMFTPVELDLTGIASPGDLLEVMIDLAPKWEGAPNADDLLVPFAKAVFKMLKKEKVISFAVINNMATWQHSGFNIHCGSPVGFSDTDAIERLARYIIRAPISQERLKYIPGNGIGKVVYEGKTTYRVETFSAIDFLARLTTHIPNKQEQSVRYYGYYSNKSRGMRAKAVAASLEADTASGTADNSPAIGDFFEKRQNVFFVMLKLSRSNNIVSPL